VMCTRKPGTAERPQGDRTQLRTRSEYERYLPGP
jgi:hypothetical protein